MINIILNQNKENTCYLVCEKKADKKKNIKGVALENEIGK